MARHRTNTELDEEQVRIVMERYGLRTKTEAVDLALRALAGQPMTRAEAQAMHGVRAMDEVPADRGPSTAA